VSGLKRSMVSALLWLFAILVMLNAGLYLLQPGMVFFPSAQLQGSPADWGLDYEDLRLQAEDGTQLHGWYLPYAGSRRVLLFLHGNAGNLSHRRASLEIFHRLGLNVLIVDYRGYGLSQGRPSEQGLYQDAAAAWRYLTGPKGFQGRDILIFGRSLGGAVAAHLAAQVEPAGLVLESTFSSARDVARYVFPWIARLLVLRYGFDTEGALARVSCPVLVLHSPSDEIIPFELGRKVYQAARPPKVFQELRGGHNDGFTLSQPSYEQLLGGFVRQVLGGSMPSDPSTG